MRQPVRMRISVGLAWIAIFGLAVLRSGAFEADPGSGLPAAVSPKRAIDPAAPAVPAELAAAMQEGRYEDARRALTALAENAKAPDDRAYFGYLRGVAERLAGNRDAARETLRTALQAEPATRWAAKIRFELAGIELASGNPAAAEELTRNEAERLLAGDRKDRLAEVYHAFARQLLEPNDPVVRPDPNAAYDLLDQARDLAKSPALRAKFLFAMGRASLAANNVGRAIDNFQAYLKEYPDGADRLSVRLQLGEAQRKANQLLPARLTWTDLARDIERLEAGRANARYRRDPGPGARRDPFDLRHAESSGRHQPQPGRCGRQAIPGRRPRAPESRARRVRDRGRVPGPGQGHPGSRCLHPFPQGGRIQGRLG